MPSVSTKQHNLMEAVAHNPGFAKKVGIPQKVGKHFHEADKKLNKGGDVKHANQLEGKAKETKSIAKEEMKALKRGHAPKEVMEHEKAEHKAMGYKKGGHVETPKKGFAMAETKGGRKPPHSHKGEEGDTKLKGFGMGKGLGKGRKVTKAATPKDEMPTKGFAMKKGGHVKHEAKKHHEKKHHEKKHHEGHTKHMRGGGKSAKSMGMGTPSVKSTGLGANLQSALQGMGGSPAGSGGASPLPQAMMKHGGHVSHHHHHHYAKGGHIKKEPESGSHMVRKVHMASSKPNRKEDGIAQRGHTRGKEVKMASGGHVGSHPSRRADGIAERGHTTCKIC